MATIAVVRTSHTAQPSVLVATWLMAELDPRKKSDVDFGGQSVTLEVQPEDLYEAEAIIASVLAERRFNGWALVSHSASLKAG